jgi:zinc/manganese transport system permease protein
MLGHPFIQHALLAGGAVAVLAGLVGSFVVLRGQVFAGDALSHVSYTGALAALAAGADLRVGLFAATIVVGLGIGLLGGRRPADDVVIGVVFAWILGLGVLFRSIFTTRHASGNATGGVTVLFGSVFGIGTRAAVLAATIAAVLVVVLLAIARPLLFASLDPWVAAARGVPVRALDAVFLAIVGAAAAEASQVVGALLLLGLLAGPAATARALTIRPWVGLVLSAVVGLVAVCIGITTAYAAPRVPASFAIIAASTVMYLASVAVRSWRGRRASTS